MKRLITSTLLLLACIGAGIAGTGKDNIAGKTPLQVAATTVSANIDLRTSTDRLKFQPSTAPHVTAGVCDPGTPDIVIHDDNEAETAYAYGVGGGADVRFADKFTPATYPATITVVCISTVTTSSGATLPFRLAIYADDAGGIPGTLLGYLPFVAHPDDFVAAPYTPAFEAFDISSLGIEIQSGESVFISINYDPAEADNVFISADQSPGTPFAGGQFYTSNTGWNDLGVPGNVFEDYRALMIRAVMPDPHTAPPSAQKAFSPSQVMAGETSTLSITLRNLQSTDAVLNTALVDALPAGLEIAATPNASTDCIGGIVTAAAGSSSVSLDAGAAIPAEGICEVSVDVVSAVDGIYTNTIPAGTLDTQLGSNPSDANADLTVGFTFPEPYCDLDFTASVEPISYVEFAGIANSSNPSVDNSPALEDFTAIFGSVVAGDTYTMTVEGNTNGGYTSTVAVYVDWNQDGAFDPVEEYHLIGTLYNSTGTDSIQAIGDIEVPSSALPGQTRMRVVKQYGSSAPPACGTGDFGQAEDYTLDVASALTMPRVSKAFAPAQVMVNAASTLTITLDNTYNTGAATLTTDFSDNLPSGLVVADAPNASTTCNGTLVAVAGTDSVTLEAGSSVPGGATCQIAVDVQSAVEDTYLNTIPAGALQTDLGDSPFDADATLKVGFVFPDPYCTANFTGVVEPISHVEFADISNSSNPTVAASPALEDFLNVTGHVTTGDIVTLAVEGNTNGPFTTKIGAYIDWNQDGVFDLMDEYYFIGDLSSSTGTDSIQAVNDITIPSTALPGKTRMRVMKKYGVEAAPCNVSGFGQAEDYTLDVTAIHQVIPSVGSGDGIITPDTAQTVNHGDSFVFTLTPDAGFEVDSVGGTCGGSFDSTSGEFTTDPVTADCTVIANFGAITHMVTPGVGAGNGTITPDTPQAVNEGDSFVFTLTPDAGFQVDGVGGSCGGSFDDISGEFTTDPVTADCTVIAEFAQITHTVTPGVGAGNGTITPDVSQTVNEGDSFIFTLTPDAGFEVDSVGGTCGGSFDDISNEYTTAPVMTDCTVIAEFASVASIDLRVEKAFIPDLIWEGETSVASVTLSNLTGTDATLTAPFVDDLPLGLDIVDATTTCLLIVGNVQHSTLGSVSLPTGTVIPANGSCTLDITVSADQQGSYVNIIPAGALQTDQGSNAAAAAATLTVAVDPGWIFCDGFEDGGDGSCDGGSGPPPDNDIYYSGPINHPIQDSIDGSSVNWITGDIRDVDVAGYHFNPYNNSTQLTFWWNTGAADVAGVSSDANSSDFLVLQSGAVVGPASAWSTTNNPGPAAWAAGADGYLGFRFNCSSLPSAPVNGICYGYVHLQSTAPEGFPATIVDYAYNQTGAAITIP